MNIINGSLSQYEDNEEITGVWVKAPGSLEGLEPGISRIMNACQFQTRFAP